MRIIFLRGFLCSVNGGSFWPHTAYNTWLRRSRKNIQSVQTVIRPMKSNDLPQSFQVNSEVSQFRLDVQVLQHPLKKRHERKVTLTEYPGHYEKRFFDGSKKVRFPHYFGWAL